MNCFFYGSIYFSPSLIKIHTLTRTHNEHSIRYNIVQFSFSLYFIVENITRDEPNEWNAHIVWFLSHSPAPFLWWNIFLQSISNWYNFSFPLSCVCAELSTVLNCIFLVIRFQFSSVELSSIAIQFNSIFSMIKYYDDDHHHWPQTRKEMFFMCKPKNYLHGLFSYQSPHRAVDCCCSPLCAVVNTIIINVIDEILISFVKIIRWPINMVFSPPLSKSINTPKEWTQKKIETRFGKMDILRHNIWYLWLKTRFFLPLNLQFDKFFIFNGERKREKEKKGSKLSFF